MLARGAWVFGVAVLFGSICWEIGRLNAEKVPFKADPTRFVITGSPLLFVMIGGALVAALLLGSEASTSTVSYALRRLPAIAAVAAIVFTGVGLSIGLSYALGRGAGQIADVVPGSGTSAWLIDILRVIISLGVVCVGIFAGVLGTLSRMALAFPMILLERLRLADALRESWAIGRKGYYSHALGIALMTVAPMIVVSILQSTQMSWNVPVPWSSEGVMLPFDSPLNAVAWYVASIASVAGAGWTLAQFYRSMRRAT